MKRLLPLVPALLLAACATNPADDPMQIKLSDVDARLGRVERVVSNQSLLDMSQRIDTLEGQLRTLRGSVEVLQNGSEGVRKQQRDLYTDLDKRIAVLEAGLKAALAAGAMGAPGPGVGAAAGTSGSAGAAGAMGAVGMGTAPGSTAAAVAGDDQAAYARAFDQLKGGEYGLAITQLQAFMKDYPQSSLLDNAQYWIGEAYYVTRDYDQAARAFRAVGDRWPGSRKAPDALLKLGYTQFEQKQLADSRATLNQVVQRFPGTDAARLAAERLAKIPAEGR